MKRVSAVRHITSRDEGEFESKINQTLCELMPSQPHEIQYRRDTLAMVSNYAISPSSAENVTDVFTEYSALLIWYVE